MCKITNFILDSEGMPLSITWNKNNKSVFVLAADRYYHGVAKNHIPLFDLKEGVYRELKIDSIVKCTPYKKRNKK